MGALALLLAAAVLTSSARLPEPDLVLWTWDRSEDLRFLPRDSPPQIASLAGTIRLRGDRVLRRPRLAPLVVPAWIRRRPVVRLEIDAAEVPVLDATRRRETLSAIAALVGLDSADSVQIDFDAPASARDFYRALLRDLRQRLPPGAKLSITALASWCLGDRWLGDLPVDEAVPMLFRMGRDDAAVRDWLAQRGELPEAKCRGSIGIGLDEPPPARPPGAVVYVFAPHAWSRSDYESARALLEARR